MMAGVKKSSYLAIVFLVGWGILVFNNWATGRIGGRYDVQYFERVGREMATVVSGQSGIINSAYPPLAGLYFYALAANPWQLSFDRMWAWMLVGLVAAVTGYSYLFFNEDETWYFPGAIFFTAWLVGADVVLARYDWLVAVALFLAWRSFVWKRDRICGFWLVIGAALKVLPIFFWPILWLQMDSGSRKNFLVGTMVGLAAALLLPLGVMGATPLVNNMTQVLVFHGQRGVQVESSWSGFNILENKVAGKLALINHHHEAHHNDSLEPRSWGLFRITLLAGLGGIYWLAWRGQRRARKVGAELLIAGGWWMIFTNNVLSPQMLVWVVPLLMLWLWETVNASSYVKAEAVVVICLLVAVGILTQWIWPLHFDELIVQQSWRAALVLNVRNLAGLAMAGALASSFWLKTRQERAQEKDRSAVVA